MSSVPRLDLHVSIDSLAEDSTPILRIARPNWFNTDDSGEPGEKKSELKLRVFSGGITNYLAGFFLEKEPEDIVLVKVYGAGTDLLIDRQKEIKTMELLHAKQCGPQLYALFNNGISYSFSVGRTLNVESCRDPHVSALVAREMARMHSVIPLEEEEGTPGTADSAIWTMLKNFQQLVTQVCDSNSELASKLDSMGISPSWLSERIEELESLCRGENMPIAFCHNDLLLGNIIYEEKRSKISFIDFEYAAPNYVPFDIANHFNEFAGVDEADFSLVPNQQFMRLWLSHYVQRYSNGGIDLEVNLLLRWVQLCIPVSHLLWILWSAYQAASSTIDFDFVNYVAIRLPEFNKGMEVARNLTKQ